MNFKERLITKLPLDKIWKDSGEIAAKRSSYLTKERIKEVLKKQPVEFAVANCGDELKWVDINKCFDFWKTEAQNHIADNFDKIDYENFPDQYAYIASEWTGEFDSPIVLLEMVH